MNNTKIRGNNFLEMLAILFIALKLIGVIDWSWIWVLSPLWGGLVLAFLIFKCVQRFC